jgi:selenocysteine-specific elongation factor
MIVGTAGHIDHGKTSLVRALTGVDTDRLKEEKARGISIELGYAYVPLVNGEVLGFVDVPGHERLVHTMVAGAGGIDFALLAIAADDGVMPQTREHLAILQLLGVDRGAIAMTKVDRVDTARKQEVQAQITALLRSTPLAAAPLFPLVATAADDPGVALLRRHLQSTAASWPKRCEDGFFRMAVDRVFTLPGLGTVATGTARAGRIQVGGTVNIMPSGRPARVRSIHAQNRDAEVGRAGQRCALNLAGIEKSDLGRGDWLADSRALIATVRIDVDLRLLRGGADLPSRAPLHIHLGTAHRVAHAVPLAGDKFLAGTAARAQLVFDAPICAAPGDAFIARDAQALRTVGGGVVIDPLAPARRRRSPERLEYLCSIERMLRGEGIEPLLRNAPEGIKLKDLVHLCGREAERIIMPKDARIVDAGGERFVFLEAHWTRLLERALDGLRAFHAREPDEPGIDRGRLRRMSAPGVSDALWRVLVDELVKLKEVLQTGHWLHAPLHRIELTESEARLAQTLNVAIAAGGFDPPWVRELAAIARTSEEEVRRVLRKCAVRGQVYQVVHDLFYDRERVRELARVLKDLVAQDGSHEAARYRDAIGVGRKRAIQILEFFDRVGYTRRTLDARIVRTDSSWFDNEPRR